MYLKQKLHLKIENEYINIEITLLFDKHIFFKNAIYKIETVVRKYIYIKKKLQ